MNNKQGQSGLGIAALILSIIGCTFLIGAILAIIDLASKNDKSKTLSKVALGICGFWVVIGIVGMIINGNKDVDDSKNQITTELVSQETTESKSEDENIDDNSQESNNEEESDVKFENDTIVTDDYTIEILEYKVIQPGEDGNKYGKNPVIAFWYNTTNTSGKDINPNTAWIYIMKAVQDNDPNMVNELNVGMLPDDAFTDSQMATIKKDGTVENAVSYELTDTETPVVLTATNGMLGEEIGSQSYEIK